METAIIILAYVANVFLSRFLARVLIKLEPNFKGIPIFIWFIPIAAPIAIALMIMFVSGDKINLNNKFYNWFSGKHW